MCIAIYYPENVQPDVGRLENSQDNNPDGFGWAIVHNDRIMVGRGMNPATVRADFIKARKHHPSGPAMFHARIATAGRLKTNNCHPFYVGRGQETVLIHNGILPRKCQPSLTDFRSDTRLLAEKYLPANRFGSLNTKAGVKALGRWAGSGNKFVILNVNSRYPFQSVIVNEHMGDWVEGAWYSNSSHEDWYGYVLPHKSGYRHWWQESTKGWDWHEDIATPRAIGKAVESRNLPAIRTALDDSLSEWESATDSATISHAECEFCLAKGKISAVSYICWACYSCQVCGKDVEGCHCGYRPDYEFAALMANNGE